MIRQFYFCFVMVASLVSLDKARAGNVVLDWNASASTNAVGYNIYYGTSSGNYQTMVDAGNATSLTVSNLTGGATYYFVATAYDADGNESAYSGEASFIVSGVLTMSLGAGPGSPVLLQFPAEVGHWYEIQATTNFQNWSSIWQSDMAVSNAWMQFSDTNAASFNARFYRLVLH